MVHRVNSQFPVPDEQGISETGSGKRAGLNREIVLFDQGIHLQRVTRVDGLCRYAWTVLACSCLSRQHAPFEHMHHPGPRLLCAPAHSASVLGALSRHCQVESASGTVDG